MRLVVFRLLVLGVLIGLYALHPLAGVAALAAGYGYVARQYWPRCGVPADLADQAPNLRENGFPSSSC